MDRKPDHGRLQKGAPSLSWLLRSWRGIAEKALALITIAGEMHSDAEWKGLSCCRPWSC